MMTIDDSRLLMRRLYCALVLLQLVPVWWWKYFPSQDGPSHLYNSAILAHYSSTPLYQQFYELHVSPAGNVLSQALQVGLGAILPPLIAEKVIISLCLVLFAVAFRYLIHAFAPSDEVFAFAGLTFGYGWFLQMGFWNFCLGMAMFLFALGYFARGGRRRVYLLLVLLTYLAHLMAWALLVACVGWLWLFRYRARVGRAALTMAPVALAVLFHTAAGTTEIQPEPALGLSSVVLTATAFLSGFSTWEWLSGMVTVAAVAAAGAARGRELLRAPLFWLTLVLLLLALAGPSEYRGGKYVRQRFGLAAAITLTLAAAEANRLPAWGRRAVVAACVVGAAGAMAARWDAFAMWNARLEEYARFAARIPAGSRVLPLSTTTGTARTIRPLLHAFGYQAARGSINLRNYEAGQSYFPVQFRTSLSPFPRLGDCFAMEKMPPQFDLSRYPWVDYVLIDGPLQLQAEPRFALEQETSGLLELRLYRRR